MGSHTADDDDTPGGPSEEQAARTKNTMRALVRLAKARHAFDEAREWAEKTLERLLHNQGPDR